MDQFKLPHSIPQDLLLIQEYVGLPAPSPPPPHSALTASNEEDDISSSSDEDEDSDDDIASEEEIAADLITGGAATDEDDLDKTPATTKVAEPLESASGSDSDSSSSDLDSDPDDKTPAAKDADLDLLDDEEDGPAPGAASTYFQTKHEIAEADITVPEVDEVGPDEVLEKVGEVMNTLERVAIIRGLPSEQANRASERALDSDTLLVFDDRKVLGYIYETFGPTTQPLYQVKFSAAHPLDPVRVRAGREVFHVPARSRFVFVSQIKAIRGSDASNVHDEEPAEDELEFSDDEAEAAFKSRLKRKRGESRARSAAPSSRQSTPNPSFMRDQELADEAAFLSRNAYDEHGPYDIDYVAGPSASASAASSSSGAAGASYLSGGRPAPVPYDDPYGDEYTAPDLVDRERKERRAAAVDGAGAGGSRQNERTWGLRSEGHLRPHAQNRSREGKERGRGRGRERGRGGQRGRGAGGGGGGQRYSSDRDWHADARGENQSQSRRELSPTSRAIARATGQAGYSNQNQNQHQHQQQQYQAQAQAQAFQPWHGQDYSHNQDGGGAGGGYGGYAGYAAPPEAAGWGYGQEQMMFMMQQQQQQQQQGYGYNNNAGYGMGGGGGYASGYAGAAGGVEGIPGLGMGMGMGGMGLGMPSGNAPFVQPHINPRFASAFGMGIAGAGAGALPPASASASDVGGGTLAPGVDGQMAGSATTTTSES